MLQKEENFNYQITLSLTASGKKRVNHTNKYSNVKDFYDFDMNNVSFSLSLSI